MCGKSGVLARLQGSGKASNLPLEVIRSIKGNGV